MGDGAGFTFESGEAYVMPGHFGPRTAEDDGRYDEVTSSVIVCTTDGDRAAALLPPGFELTDPPTMIVVHAENRGVHFMAGRGYNLVLVNLACRFRGEQDTIEGSYALAMWEDEFMPVVLGREFIGAPKFVADVPVASIGEGRRRFTVSEFGTKLMDGEISELVPLGDEETAQIEQQFNERSWMGWRLLPTPDARGVEVSYPTLIDVDRTLDAAWLGEGAVSFHAVTRDQAPVSHLVATTLAQLPVIETQAAIVTHGTLYQGHARRLA
jgi:hypothetical protein